MKIFRWLQLLALIGLLNWQPLFAQTEPAPTITLWHPYSGPQQAELDMLVARYNADNSDRVAVSAISFANSGLLYDQIILQLTSAGQLPNLAMVWPHEAALFNLGGAAANLSLFSSLGMESWLPSEVGQDPISQQTIAIPHSAFGMIMAVNLDALAELGYADLPATWEELQAVACALRENGGWSGGQFGVAWGLTGTLEAESWLALNLNADNAPFVDGTYRLDTEALAESVTMLKAMQETGCAILELDRALALDTFASGRAVFLLLPSSSLSILQSAIERNFSQPFAWGAFVPPTAEAMLIYTPSFMMFDASPTANNAAWTFLEWFLSPDINTQWASATYTLPVNRTAALTSPLPQFQHIWEAVQTTPIIPLPTLAGYDVVRLEIRFALQRLLADITTLDNKLSTLDMLANHITQDFYGLSENAP